MRLAHLLITLMLVVIWGMNFVVIKCGLHEMSPLVFCTLRFMFVSLPLVFFIKRPPIPLRALMVYGVIMFAVQFGLLFTAILVGLTAGMASLLLQLQAFFTILLAIGLLAERPTIWQLGGAGVAFLGLAIVFGNVGGDVSLAGLLMVIAAAFSWSVSSIMAKRFGKINMFSLVIWGSLFAWPALLMATFYLEGTESIRFAMLHMSWLSVAAIFYNVLPVTIIGFGSWNWLLSKYPAAMIAPFTLLVPITGFISSVLIFGEVMQPWKWEAAAFIVIGLAINVAGSLSPSWNRQKAAEAG